MMIQYKSILLTLLLWHMAFNTTAQYGNVWVFGSGAGIDFNSSPPRAIKTAINTSEGSTSVCNAAGELLFYTDGTSVWNRDHRLMPNGTDILLLDNMFTTRSTAQAALIVPVPGEREQYYVFSLTSMPNCHLYYNIVDMSLDSGLGDIVAGRKMQLAENLTEHMIAVSGHNCNVWLLTLSGRATGLQAYSIGFNGIDTLPVVTAKTPGAGTYNGDIGTMAISPDRSKLVIAQGNLAIYDFDGSTGKISNEIMLDKRADYYGVAFSADNSKVYGRTTEPVYQFDLSAGDSADIVASKTLILNSYLGYGTLQRGPDDKIYIARDSGIGIIHKPDLPGLRCNYEKGGLQLAPGTSSSLGFPSFPTLIVNKKYYSNSIDSIFCADSFLLTAKNPAGTNYQWNDGVSAANRQVYHSGTHWLRYQVLNDNCDEYVDTFHVTLFPIGRNYTTTTFGGRCQADTFAMTASNTNLNHYLWEDNITTGKTRKTNTTGLYWLSYRNDSLCEHYIDSFMVSYPEKDYTLSFRADTLVCENDVITFTNTSDLHFNSFSWHWGNGDSSIRAAPEYSYREAGSYTVTLTGTIDGICPDTTVQTIVVDAPVPVAFILAPDSICAGQAITLHQALEGPTLSSLHWDFGDGNALSSRQQMLQHAYTLPGARALTLRAVFRACPESAFTGTVYVFDPPLVNLGADTGLCLHAAPLYLKNLVLNLPEPVHYLWNTGDTTGTIRIKHPGTYSLQVRSGPLSCSTTEAVTVAKNCYLDIPNTFTPNGDGVNDFFFPRQLLSDNISRFRMQVHNRWGQILFESNALNGRGWDGRFNGQIQPQGVYIYSIAVERKNHPVESYQGNVTLIR